MATETKTYGRIASTYFKDVGQHVLPTKDEELALFTAYKQATKEELETTDEKERKLLTQKKIDLRHKIACGYLRFVISAARKKTRDEGLLQELIAEGNIGLMVGIEKFDLDRGFRFLTYAASWINVYMQEHLNKLTHVHVPNHTRKEIRKKRKEEEKLINLGKMTQYTVEEPTTTPIEPSQHCSDLRADDKVKERDKNILMHMNNAGLSFCEKLVLIHYFGLKNYKAKTFQEMSLYFYELDGSVLTSDKIRQIKDKTLVKLKSHLKVVGLDALEDVI